MYHLDEIVPHKDAIRSAYDALPELETWCSEYERVRCGLQNLLSEIDDFERFGDTGGAYGCAHIYKYPSGKWGYYNDRVDPATRYLEIRFSSGAYFFGDDYDTELFNEFFAMLSSDTNPLCIDTPNHALLYAESDSKQALAKLNELVEAYNEKHKERFKERRVEKLRRELERLESTQEQRRKELNG